MTGSGGTRLGSWPGHGAAQGVRCARLPLHQHVTAQAGPTAAHTPACQPANPAHLLLQLRLRGGQGPHKLGHAIANRRRHGGRAVGLRASGGEGRGGSAASGCPSGCRPARAPPQREDGAPRGVGRNYLATYLLWARARVPGRSPGMPCRTSRGSASRRRQQARRSPPPTLHRTCTSASSTSSSDGGKGMLCTCDRLWGYCRTAADISSSSYHETSAAPASLPSLRGGTSPGRDPGAVPGAALAVQAALAAPPRLPPLTRGRALSTLCDGRVIAPPAGGT